MLRKILAVAIFLFAASQAVAAPRVDIYGPGQNVVNLGLAAPLTAPNAEARQMGATLQKLVSDNLSFLPFMRLTDPKTVLGGTVLAGVEPPAADFNRFQLAGSDIVVTTIWPSGDSGGTRTVQMRAFETSGGARLFGKEYPNVSSRDLPEVADRFCADLLEVLTGNGSFFRSTLCFVLKKGKMSSQVCLVKPTGRDFRQITNIRGEAMSPAWSPDGRFIVFTHIDERSHSLGVWDLKSRRVQRVRFPGDVVIGPSFLPNNKVAVALSNGKYPVIYQLNHVFKKERVLESDSSINVSPTFDKTGTKMAFTSSRLGGPQIFMKDLSSGAVTRVSQNGSYNTEANLSPDGTLVVFSRLTSYGQRIFVQDLVTGAETQVSFGPGSDEQPSFCADSYFIAFSSSRGGQRSIYLTTRHGGDAKRVPVKGDAFFPRWGIPSGTR
ncbi:MAG TPA: translocation protein TolB [Candidatus Desulfovibrio intestinipullorum]|uniref:Translocation protein TolB n=1 Tax=Candidatus Desulfovibrio intestinipullorum TaxID=2838536 RepID=A0A9D1TNM3_9BACT|nr:translocation protein TolB [Candidatus Desulfovibrio intestinipullorum]